jgi:hypothetical protein
VDSPPYRDISSPITDDDLSPLPADSPGVAIRSALTSAEYRQVAGLLERHPEKELYATQPKSATPNEWSITSLDFLQYFPELRRFSTSLYHLRSLEGLQYLTHCTELIVFRMANRLSVAPIAGMPVLERLFLAGQHRDRDALNQLDTLRWLSLQYAAQLKTLDWLPNHLRSFSMNVGSITDISGLARHPGIEDVSFHKTKLLADLSPLAEMTGLTSLYLAQLSKVTSLFDMSGLQQLRKLQILTLRKLTDTTPLLAATNLTELFLYDLPALDPQSWHDTCTGWLAQGKAPFWEQE